MMGKRGSKKRSMSNVKATSLAVGEEGGYKPSPKRPSPPRASTDAVGEEGGKKPLKPPVKPPVSRKPSPKPPAYSTQRVGEEGGKKRPSPPRVTSQAVGEEGGKKPPMKSRPNAPVPWKKDLDKRIQKAVKSGKSPAQIKQMKMEAEKRAKAAKSSKIKPPSRSGQKKMQLHRPLSLLGQAWH